MKIFQTVQSQYAILGITRSSNHSTQELPFNGKILFGFLLFGCLIISGLVYILHVASGFMEQMQGVSSILASTMMCICFVDIVLGKTTLFEIIDNVEKLLDASEHHLNVYFFDK